MPCSYLYRSSHWIGKSMSSLRLWVVFELTHESKCAKLEPEVTYGMTYNTHTHTHTLYTYIYIHSSIWDSLMLAAIKLSKHTLLLPRNYIARERGNRWEEGRRGGEILLGRGMWDLLSMGHFQHLLIYHISGADIGPCLEELRHYTEVALEGCNHQSSGPTLRRCEGRD